MKKLLLLATLCVFAFSTKAQELNFEKTVKYINDKIESNGCDESYKESYLFLKNGDFISRNTPKKKKNIFNYEGVASFKADKEEGGIALAGNRILLIGKDNSSIGLFCVLNIVIAERLYKALIHLRSLCTKEKDPFDN